MNKDISINGKLFSFQLWNEENLWYLGKNEVDVFNIGYTTNVTFRDQDVDWQEVETFLTFLCKNNANHDNLQKANAVLTSFFRELYSKLAPDIDYSKLYFTLCNIEYLGIALIENERRFRYMLSFNIQSKIDNEFFTYTSWNASFVNNNFTGISKE